VGVQFGRRGVGALSLGLIGHLVPLRFGKLIVFRLLIREVVIWRYNLDL
jgi:hypothetical protein